MIAEATHGANCVYSRSLGEHALPWNSIPHEEQGSVADGVEYVLSVGPLEPEEIHERWVAEKLERGWKLGEKHDRFDKTHPNLVPWEELPLSQQVKDRLFLAIVEALRPAV